MRYSRQAYSWGQKGGETVEVELQIGKRDQGIKGDGHGKD